MSAGSGDMTAGARDKDVIVVVAGFGGSVASGGDEGDKGAAARRQNLTSRTWSPATQS